MKEFNPVEILPGEAGCGLLLLCDHASNAFPPGYGTLGVAEDQLQRHIAYDIGAAALTRELNRRLAIPAAMTTYSRLFIDPNRGRDDPTLVMRLSDGAIVPGNRHITDDEKQHRIETYYDPYDRAISARIEAGAALGKPPALFSIHSFTPVWRGVPRPWHAAILWDKDPRLAVPFIRMLEAEGDLVVGDNEPYTGALHGDTMYRHGTAKGLAHALIEVRQDLIGHQAGVMEWADRLAPMLQKARDLPDLNAIIHYGSLSD